MARKRRKPAELRAASGDLYYEYDMLCVLETLLRPKGIGKSHLGKGLLEAFLVHVRNLYDFFFPRRARRQDLLAEDFFPTPRGWNGVRGKIPIGLRKDRPRIDVMLSHLSYSRQDIKQSEWHCTRIKNDVQGVMKRFLDSVSEEFLNDDWRSEPPPQPVDWTKPVIGRTD
jgi:hypothetical protein